MSNPALRCVLVAGGSGFIGRALCSRLHAKGYHPVILTRGNTVALHHPHSYLSWQQLTNTSKPFPQKFEAIINLSGEPVFSPRPWSSAFRSELVSSRLSTTRALVDAIARAPDAERPKVLINASGVGFYPSTATAASAPVFDESYAGAKGAETNFWTDLSSRWEAEAERVRDVTNGSVRAAYLRTGLVLGKTGGAYQQMALPFRFGLGSPFGSGSQPFPWIHLNDVVSLYVAVLENPQLSGPVNAVAPEQIDNNQFTRTLAATGLFGRPVLPAVPGGVLQLALGKDRAAMLLEGQKVVPKKALDAGFQFEFPTIKSAVAELVSK